MSGPSEFLQDVRSEATSPDAELIRLCAAFHSAHRAWYSRSDDFSDEWEATGECRNAVSDSLVHIPPLTDAGRVAKARVALIALHEYEPDPACRDWVHQLAYAALRDIAGDVA